MKTMRKIFVLMLAVLLLFAGCASKPEIDPQYYEVGKQTLGIVDAFLAKEISLDDAHSRIDVVMDAADKLPLLSPKDPAYEQSDKVLLYVNAICFNINQIEFAADDPVFLASLEKYSNYLSKALGFN